MPNSSESSKKNNKKAEGCLPPYPYIKNNTVATIGNYHYTNLCT